MQGERNELSPTSSPTVFKEASPDAEVVVELDEPRRVPDDRD